jgi:hypothetical protein
MDDNEIPKTLIENIVPKKVAEDIQVNMRSIEWLIEFI